MAPAPAARILEELRILTPRKLWNVFMAAVQVRLKSARLWYRPTRISIETGNICNLRCPLCPTGRGDPDVTRGFMAWPDYCRLIDELAPDLLLVRLYNWGEPLLNRDLVRMARYARERRIAVTISTNLNVLTPERARELMASGLQKIFISCNGATPLTYDIYHVNGDFDRVMGNMALLQREKQSQADCHTGLIWLFHVFRHNEHEVDRARDMARRMGVEIRINPMRTDMGREIFETARQAIERDHAWIPEDPRYCAFDLEAREATVKKNFCGLPWKETVINWDGAVLPCCSVYQEKYSFGNAFRDGFAPLWNGPAYQAARREIAGRENSVHTICHICKATGFTHF